MIAEVDLLGGPHELLDGHALCRGGFCTAAIVVRPPVVGEVGVTCRPSMIDWKLSIRAFCQPGSRPSAKDGSVGRLPRTPIADGVRWKT